MYGFQQLDPSTVVQAGVRIFACLEQGEAGRSACVMGMFGEHVRLECIAHGRRRVRIFERCGELHEDIAALGVLRRIRVGGVKTIVITLALREKKASGTKKEQGNKDKAE